MAEYRRRKRQRYMALVPKRPGPLNRKRLEVEDRWMKSCSEGRRNIVTAGLKSVLGGIPVVGSLCSEIIGAVIPNQRIDRIAEFVAELAEKLKDVSEEQVRQRMMQKEVSIC